MKNTIRCPKCGREYLPCEIYLPDEFLGKSYTISRDEEGCIDYISGTNMGLSEEYCCDECGTHFLVSAEVEFTTTALDEILPEGYISVV